MQHLALAASALLWGFRLCFLYALREGRASWVSSAVAAYPLVRFDEGPAA